MTPEEVKTKLVTLVDTGMKLGNQISDENEAKMVKDYVATLSYYLGMFDGASETEAREARSWRAFRKHMVIGKGVGEHPEWIYPKLRKIPFTSYDLDQMIETITDKDGEMKIVVDE